MTQNRGEASQILVTARRAAGWMKRMVRKRSLQKHRLLINQTPGLSALQATNDHLLAEQEAIRATNAHLLAEQQAIRGTNEHLLGDQYQINAHNEYLQREQEWLRAANEELQAEQDRLNGAKPPAPEDPSKMKMAPGMMSKFDIEGVTELAKQVLAGGTIVDVGSLLGLSTSLWCIHSSAARIVSIDPWKYEPWLESFRDANGPITKEAFLKNVPDERVETIQGYSPQCAQGWTAPIDLYWEDGDHINPGCGESIRFWSNFVKPGGIACGHDVHLRDVRTEAEALAARWGSEMKIFGTVWSVRRPLKSA